MLGGQDKVVYLLRTPRLIVLALAADSDRNAGTGLGGLGTARWIIGGCFYSMRPASGESVTTHSMRALQAGGEQETIGAPLGRAVRKSGGSRGFKPFCIVVLFSGPPDRLYITARLQTGRHRTPPERSCMCLLMTC